MVHTAEYVVGTTSGIVTFDSRARVWRTLVIAAINAVIRDVANNFGVMLDHDDIELLIVDGNAA